MNVDLGNIFVKRDAESRSLSAENFRGEKGAGAMATEKDTLAPRAAQAARDLGRGWKVSPYIPLAPGQSVEVMDNDGPGVIRHVWFTFDAKFQRELILRAWWDGEDRPSVECPAGDFFCNAWKQRQFINSQAVNVNPNGGMNCFLPMPFRRHARISVTNESPEGLGAFFYTINYTLEDVDDDALYLHAQWRRTNPLPYATEYTVLEGVKGRGHYVGTFMAWQQNSDGWWGEGEVKMYLEGDEEFPTICGTGTEDYFGGAWNFAGRTFSAPFFGYQLVSGEKEQPGSRHTMYRFHVPDPVFFREDIKVTMQALGWRSGRRYQALQDDISSVAYWYQTEPHSAFPALPGRDFREIT
jgi:hypothetical protein